MNYAEYKRLLKISKHNLDAELEVQADIMERIAAEVVRTGTEARAAKDKLAEVEGRLSSDLKGEKTNAEERAARIKSNPQRRQAWVEFQEASQEADMWSHLLEAWKQRGFSIKTLSDLYAASYFSVNSHQAPARDADAQRRQAMQEAREHRHERAASRALDSAREAGLQPRTVRRRMMD